ncbi:MAG: DUF3039 domain-containing protein [Propionibacteriaceae bacterium]|jgi:hypothetical protein|nr:DUF3039 domain-containing protein [Propionibacteriaceae bacterium]
MAEGQAGGATLLDERVREQLDDGDHDRFAHFVDKVKLTEALVMGTPVQALCGKIWVPSRSPEKYPVCPMCQEVYELLRPGDGECS